MQAERFSEFLSLFADVAREGSFSAAARRRGVTPSSVARQIDMLEAQLDVPLFLRSTRSLRLTDAGQALLVRARRVLDELADAQQEIASIKGGVAGSLRVACAPSFGKRYVIPVMTILGKRYPLLRFDLDLTERLAHPVTERLDVVIRIGDMVDSTLIATRVGTQTRVLCASPDYLGQMEHPGCRADLTKHRLIDKVHGADLLGWADLLGRPASRSKTRPIFACDDFEAMRLAVLGALGVGYLPDWVVGPDIRNGALVQLLPEWSSDPRSRTGIFALRALAKPSASVRLFIDELRRQVGEPPSWSISREAVPLRRTGGHE